MVPFSESLEFLEVLKVKNLEIFAFPVLIAFPLIAVLLSGLPDDGGLYL